MRSPRPFPSTPGAPRRGAASRRRFLAALGGLAAGPMAHAVRPLRADGQGYPGMHDSAAWRRDALRRIEETRLRAWSVRVVDKGGAPLAGVRVEGALVRHHYGFGAGVRLRRLFDARYPEALRSRYLELVSSRFHKTVAVNAMKWKHIEANREFIEPFLAWAEAQALPVRGHTLVWPDFQRAPPPVAALRDDPEALRATIRKHVLDTASAYAGRIAEWDVLNEPFTSTDYFELLGEDVAADWFRDAREADPAALRYINDYGVLTRVNEKHQAHYFGTIRRLLAQGAPLQGIGFQAHNPARFGLTAPEDMLATLDRFAAFGLPLQITEFDVERTDRDLQARYTSDFLIAVYAHPATVGLLTWTPFEYEEGEVSKPEAAFYDRKLRPRPNALAWDELVNDRWRTRVAGVTDSEGRLRFRGVPGAYELDAAAASVAGRFRVCLAPGADEAVVSL